MTSARADHAAALLALGFLLSFTEYAGVIAFAIWWLARRRRDLPDQPRNRRRVWAMVAP